VIPTKRAIDIVVKEFLEDRIITRFGVPSKITTDNAKAFSSTELSSFCFDYGIILSHSSNYYPQGNGLVESSNKNLMAIIRRLWVITRRVGITNSSMLFGQIES
jgi:transposase InsO family protein